jgi:hypothetical protein
VLTSEQTRGLHPKGHARGVGARRTIELDDYAKVQPADGQTAVWDDARHLWVPRSFAVDDLADVVFAGPAAGDILIWNGTTFVNQGFGAALYDSLDLPWTGWTPTVTQNVTRAGTTNTGKVRELGRDVYGSVKWTSTVVGSANTLEFSYPFGLTPDDTGFESVGSGYINDAATNPLVEVVATATGFQFALTGTTVYGTALAVGTVVVFSFQYEAA